MARSKVAISLEESTLDRLDRVVGQAVFPNRSQAIQAAVGRFPMTLYTEREIRELLVRDEGQYLERKSVWDQAPGSPRLLDRRTVRDAIAECVAAFANAEGGDLVLGVEDDGEPTGHAYPEEAVHDFFLEPQRRLRPPVTVRTQRAHVEEKELLLIRVGTGERAVLLEGNGFPYRVGDAVVYESEEAINARKEAYRQVGHEQMIRREATVGDLDLDLARSVLAKTVRGGRALEEALEAYGLIHRGPEGIRVTNAALLLFGKPPLARWHAHAEILLQGSRQGATPRRPAQRHAARPAGASDRSIDPGGDRYAGGQIRRSERLHDRCCKPSAGWNGGFRRCASSSPSANS
jgi:ATP-dependent DNA helicase RecG